MSTVPNVLYFGSNDIKRSLTRCLHPDKYAVYEFTATQATRDPWQENTALLVVAGEGWPDTDNCHQYLEKGGKLLVVAAPLKIKEVLDCKEQTEKTVTLASKLVTEVSSGDGRKAKWSYSLQGGVSIVEDNDGNPLVQKLVTKSGSRLVVSELRLFSRLPNVEHILKYVLSEEFGLLVRVGNTSKLTPGYIVLDNNTVSELDFEDILLSKLSDRELGEIKAPLLKEAKVPTSFNKLSYYNHLKTKHFGKKVVFFPVVTSTMIPAEQLPDKWVVVASRQAFGKGRGGNVWLSPEGCAMFTLHLRFSLSSKVGQRLSVVQHMATLAVAHGICKPDDYKQLDLKLKWPNDLYMGSVKIGGVLVNTTIQGDDAHVYIGIGVNVANKHPTICINSAIADLASNIKPFGTEEVIAITLTELEHLVNSFEDSGPEKFLDLYYKYWMHADQKVTLGSMGKEAVIKGLDEYGFLVVESEGERLTLQPDGNRFDMLKNLIVAK